MLPELMLPELMMIQQLALLPHYHFRPALPRDRYQIYQLLHSDQHQRGVPWQQLRQGFGWGIVLALGLHLLLIIGGLQLLFLGLMSIAAVVLGAWLGRWLFGDWQNYWVIEQNNRLVACSKLTCYRTYAVLSDVMVRPECRQQGIGSFLVKACLQQAGRPTYLACFPDRVKFYQRLQFIPVDPRLLSAYLRRSLELNLEPGLVPLVYSAFEANQSE
jgi:amino-acid N-acetyltransferase